MLVLSIGETPEVIPKDTLSIEDNYFWEKLSFRVGYSGGLYWTGQELAKQFESSPVAGLSQLPKYLGAHLYWLNSIEGSITYHVNDNWGIEIGPSYGWTRIDKHSSLSYDIENILFNLSLIHKKHIIGISYIDAHTTKITGSESFYYYQGEGRGYKVSYCYQVSKLFRVNVNLGQVEYKIIQDENEYKITQYLNGIEFSISQRFNF